MRKALLVLASFLESLAAKLRTFAHQAELLPRATTSSSAAADEEESEMMAIDPHLRDLLAPAFEKKEELA